MGNAFSSQDEDAVCSGFRVGEDGQIKLTDVRRSPVSSDSGNAMDTGCVSEDKDVEVEMEGGQDKVGSLGKVR